MKDKFSKALCFFGKHQFTRISTYYNYTVVVIWKCTRCGKEIQKTVTNIEKTLDK